MLRIKKRHIGSRKKAIKNVVVGLIVAIATIIISIPATPVLAANNGANQWPGGRIGYRLDTHYGQVAANAPDIPLYLDEACTQPNGAHRLEAGDWAVVYFPANQYGNYGVTYPITQPQDGGIDDGNEYTTHYIRGSDLHYIVSGTGSFSGVDWDENAWWNHLPTNISYTSALPGNGDTTYVGNSVDGGVAGGFNVIDDGYGYYHLTTGDFSARVMYSYIPTGAGQGWCYYDQNHADPTDADHAWAMLSQGWSQAGLHEGTNLISFAGMDASGNFATGQRYLKWDTKAPTIDTDLNNTQAVFSHNGWLNLADFVGNDTYIIASNEDTSATNDVSGLNPASLRTNIDGETKFGDSDGYQGFDSFSSLSGTKNMSLHDTMQAMGVQADGFGGQGTHSFQFSSIDNAGNTGACGASVQIDTIAPTVSYSPNSSDWTNKSQSATIKVSDSGSGVQSYKYRISSDGGDTWGDWSSDVTGSPSAKVNLDKQGMWIIQTQATDVAGNTSTSNSGEYDIDMTAPSATYSPAAGGWSTSKTVTITPSDTGGSGVKSYVYRTSSDGGKTWSDWSYETDGDNSTDVYFYSEGVFEIQTQVTDNAGNTGTVNSGMYNIDQTPHDGYFDPDYSDWTNNLTVAIHASDSGGSGLGTSYWRISQDGGTTWSGNTAFTGSTTTVDLPQGQDVLAADIYDNAGNMTTIYSGEYWIDKTPPTGTFDPNSSGWTNNNDVTLNATDTGGSGMGTSYYEISSDGGQTWSDEQEFYGESAYIELPEGNDIIKAQLQLYDNAGNETSIQSGQYYIDTTAPTGFFDPNESNWTNNLTVSVHASDAGGSGLGTSYWRISQDGGATWSDNTAFTGATTTVDLPQGQDVLAADIYDNVGNMTTIYSGEYWIDKTPPTVVYDPASSPWANNQSVDITASDEDSGMKSARWRLSTDGGKTWTTYTDFDMFAYVDLPEGRDVLQTDAYDVAGNESTTTSGTYLVDKTPPTCAADPVNQSDWHHGGAPVTLDFEDPNVANSPGSGVAVRAYYWSQDSDNNNGTYQTYTVGKQLSPPGSGDWYIHWDSKDAVGNESTGVLGPYNNQSGLYVKIQQPNATYLTNSDVVTSVNVEDNSATPVLPGDNVVITFSVKNPDGSIYTTQDKDVVVPQDNSNLVWFKWHTSSDPGNYTLSATAAASDVSPQASWSNTLPWNIANPFENTPPDPQGRDHMANGFTIAAPPNRTSLPTASWTIWTYVDGAFQKNTYQATLNATLTTAPGPNTPTAFSSGGQWTMKSGYGLTENEHATLSSNQQDAITSVQNVTSFYPEFNYETYNRNLQQTSADVFELAPNIYSFFKSRVHFTPVDFPDGTYTVQSYAYNAWSPAGMLSIYSTDSINIQGNAFNDWYPHLDD